MKSILTDSYQLYPVALSSMLPLVIDSPHSGLERPDDFACLASLAQIKTGWDAYVDELWLPAHALGATVLAARVSRMYIDLNRAPDDIDAALLAGVWPSPLHPSVYSQRGMGLIRALAVPGQPMYQQPLTVAAVQNRIDHYYQPYHQCLAALLQQFRQQFGQVWHIDCHSMKSKGNAMNIDHNQARADIVIGDLDGRSADPEFSQLVAQSFQSLGYQVAVNYPYKGGYLTASSGQPKLQQHSIQIEINRSLYMHEQQFCRNDNFQQLQRDLHQVSQTVVGYIQQKLQRDGNNA